MALQSAEVETSNYPIFLPRSSSLSEKVIQPGHTQKLYGGATLQ